MTNEQIVRSLLRAGAPLSEARDLAEILHINGWSDQPGGKATIAQLTALSTLWADWRAEKHEQFGPRWPEVQAILRALEGYGIFVADVNPANISFGD